MYQPSPFLKTLDQLEQEDETIAGIMKTVRMFHSRPLDTYELSELARFMGTFSQYLIRLGVSTPYQKALRMDMENIYEDATSKIILNGTDGVTKARSQAKSELISFSQEIVAQTQLTTTYEHLHKNISQLVSVIQSAVRIKLAERDSTIHADNV